MNTHIFTEEVERLEKGKRTLRENMRADRERFHQDGLEEWNSPKTQRRTALLTVVATVVLYVLYACVQAMPAATIAAKTAPAYASIEYGITGNWFTDAVMWLNNKYVSFKYLHDWSGRTP